MVNPYYCYVFSFVVALLTYTLGWSGLYPSLTSALLIFLGITFICHFVIGMRVAKSRVIEFKSITIQESSALLITLFIFLLWAIEFIYEGGVPLFKILLKQSYNYRLFGVPSLHVFVVTFSSFYTVYLFHAYLSSKSRTLLALYVLNLSAALLIYSRAMLFVNLASSLFIYLIFIGKIPLKKIAWILLVAIPLFYVFGMLGSLRVSREGKKPYSNQDFMEIGKANDKFDETRIPHEFFWAYIYISSPLANLQQNVNTYPVLPLSVQAVPNMVNNEILPDFLSKRINRVLGRKPYPDMRIPGPFNVSTVYSRSYSYAGWLGMTITALIILCIPLLLLRFMSLSDNYFLSAWAILCTMFFFMAYDNSLRFTGLSLQLFYPLVLQAAVKKFPTLRRYF